MKRPAGGWVLHLQIQSVAMMFAITLSLTLLDRLNHMWFGILCTVLLALILLYFLYTLLKEIDKEKGR